MKKNAVEQIRSTDSQRGEPDPGINRDPIMTVILVSVFKKYMPEIEACELLMLLEKFVSLDNSKIVLTNIGLRDLIDQFSHGPTCSMIEAEYARLSSLLKLKAEKYPQCFIEGAFNN